MDKWKKEVSKVLKLLKDFSTLQRFFGGSCDQEEVESLKFSKKKLFYFNLKVN